jgi:hypothetical protein
MAKDEGIHLNADGTAVLIVSGSEIKLRRPTLAEYAEILDQIAGIDDDRRASIVAVRDLAVKISELRSDADLADEVAHLQTELRRASLEVRKTNASYLVGVAKLLGQGDVAILDDPDRAPAWVADLSIMPRFLTHWETAPFPGMALAPT